MIYYTLLIKWANYPQEWAIEFGDYEYKTVQDERRFLEYEYDQDIKQTKIITHFEKYQKRIVDALNKGGK